MAHGLLRTDVNRYSDEHTHTNSHKNNTQVQKLIIHYVLTNKLRSTGVLTHTHNKKKREQTQKYSQTF